MVRRCVVPNCHNNDQEVLSHRFPRKRDRALKWAQNLELKNFNLDYLISKYTVCYLHFEDSAYKNIKSNRLNSTAYPKINPLRPRLGNVEVIKLDPSDTDDLHENISTEYIDIHSENYAVKDASMTEEEIDDIETSNTSVSADIEVISPDEETGEVEWIVQFPNILCNISKDHEALDEPVEVIESDVDNDEFVSGLHNTSSGDHKEVDRISTIDESDDFHISVVDATTQVDLDELERSDDEDTEFRNLTRKDLIQLLKTRDKIFHEQQHKLETFQKAHENLLRSIDTFKSLMNV